jgi:hypothetical protein
VGRKKKDGLTPEEFANAVSAKKNGKGPGWIPTMIHLILSKYIDTKNPQEGFFQAMFRFPVATLLKLQRAALLEAGFPLADAPDHIHQARVSARNTAKAFIAEHFEVLPKGEPAPHNALMAWLQENPDITVPKFNTVKEVRFYV